MIRRPPRSTLSSSSAASDVYKRQAFRVGPQVYWCQHTTCMFGAVGSVHAWERIGAALAHLAHRFLHLALFRYVDDYYGPDRRETMAHGVQCFARLVRTILGPGSIAEAKVESGDSLVILGIEVRMNAAGIAFRPNRDKSQKWQQEIQRAMRDRRLLPGCASKLAGRLAWACSRLFHRFGRALVRPIFDQKTRWDGEVDDALLDALGWWYQIFDLHLAEEREWVSSASRPAHLFVCLLYTSPSPRDRG